MPSNNRNDQLILKSKSCAVIVAHPDDETLWAGGTILMNTDTRWTIVSLCRKSDTERFARFFKALEEFGASGAMADLDDSVGQPPLDSRLVQNTIMQLLPSDEFDIVFTHSICGEYTRHIRHEETAQIVLKLWQTNRIRAKQLWQFAYEDGNGKYLPRPVKNADVFFDLPPDIWQKKREIMTKVYRFHPDSFEACAASRQEAFWILKESQKKVKKGGQ